MRIKLRLVPQDVSLVVRAAVTQSARHKRKIFEAKFSAVQIPKSTDSTHVVGKKPGSLARSLVCAALYVRRTPLLKA